MQRYPDTGPSEQELRMRAAERVARRRSFTVSLVVVGSLILLNLFFYSQTHNNVWLLLDAVFALTLAYRAWVAFGGDRHDDTRIRREVERLRGPNASVRGIASPPVQTGPQGWAPPVPPPPAAQQPVQRPPAGSSSGPPRPDDRGGSGGLDPWSGAWNF